MTGGEDLVGGGEAGGKEALVVQPEAPEQRVLARVMLTLVLGRDQQLSEHDRAIGGIVPGLGVREAKLAAGGER